ncbi:MAG TPA: hypothetical protein VFF73_30925 [Planctomycetota bacterium]|nr:hypothetical protein [Planctomycetota bacterium]
MGTRDEICLAEFSAVFLEHLLGAALNVVLFGETRDVSRVLEHARWFTDEHYAPFPISFDEAFRCLRAAAEPAVLVRLSPVFFRLRAFELSRTEFRTQTVCAAFSSLLALPATGLLGDAVSELRETLELLEIGMNVERTSR